MLGFWEFVEREPLVPEFICSARTKPNKRVSLQCDARAPSLLRRTISPNALPHHGKVRRAIILRPATLHLRELHTLTTGYFLICDLVHRRRKQRELSRFEIQL